MGIPANQAAPASGGEAGPPRQGAPGRGPQQTWLPRKVAPGKTLVARLSWDGTSSGKPALTLNCIRAAPPWCSHIPWVPLSWC